MTAIAAAIPPQAINYRLNPAPMTSSPIIRFPCQPYIAKWLRSMLQTEAGPIQLSRESLLGLTIAAQCCSPDTYIARQKELNTEWLRASVTFHVDFEHYLLTDDAILRLNRYLAKWFIQTVQFQITVLRSTGYTQREVIDWLMSEYDIDETDLSSDAFKKISYRARQKVGVVFKRGKLYSK